ncbi:hypothetical protein I3843_14G010500 [Carya illinoinensis]|uniref:U-box domain-containing protein n=1 Tax=Carya illinoinensis TaxID=32201 RepID=A0A922AFP1_CARIL|nr:hypothetical protein I3842_14G010400 [Carya illinoinensis]KAG6677134.1 hypothetical protein I3842_14G010400 [Carya illinoinensis]KAG7945888.1 hypothetical protein I3843_14G010500 [Carya illinoinensis]
MEVKHQTVRYLTTKLSSVSEQTQVEALSELRLMTKLDANARPIIAEAGAIPYLVDTLYSSSHVAQDDAAATLLNLSISSRAALMSTRGLLDALSHVLRHHASSSSPTAVQSSAATLHSLLIEDEYRPIIGSKRDIIYSLIDVIKQSRSAVRSVKDALKALFGISLYPLNRKTVVDLGGVGPLFSLILKGSATGIIEDATAVIAQVAGCEESEEAFRKASGVGVLLDLLDVATGSSMRVKENAVAALLNLVRYGKETLGREVREMGLLVVEGIAEVAENGNPKGKSKAVALLRVLYGGSNGCVVRDERFDYLLNH